MKASILIANYNNGKFIKNCIRSLKKQTYKNIEIIFFDDNSLDNSLIEIKKFSKVKVIKNKRQKKYGSFNQINAYKKAILKSTGDVIFFLDSDDFFHKNKISKVMNKFTDDKNIQIIFDLPLKKYGKKIIHQNYKYKIFRTYWPYVPPQSCITIKKEHINKIIKFIDFDLFPNIWMDFRIGIYAKFILNNFYVLRENLTFYRITKSNVSAKFKFLSSPWWKRRLEAHNYIQYFFLKNKIKYEKNLDYLLTFSICRFFFKNKISND